MTRGWSPVLIDQTHPALKKKENFKEVLIHNHSQQIFSADLLSRFSSADLLSRFSQQIFLADLLSRSSQQIFLSRSSQQIFSADLLSRSSQQIFSAEFLRIFSADFLSRSSQQIFSADLLICCGQGLVVSYCLIILIICCGQGLVVRYCLIILVVYVGGLYCMSSLEGPFRGAFGKTQDHVYFLPVVVDIVENMAWLMTVLVPALCHEVSVSGSSLVHVKLSG